MGYVYVVGHINSKGLTKIGITRRPTNRINQLGGDDLTLRAMMVCLNPEQTEKDLHTKFKEYRLPQSEWFDLTEDHLTEVFHRLELEHKQAISYMKELISHIVKPVSTSTSINQIEGQSASPPPPIPTPSGEPEWDRNYQKWRYIDKDGLARESDSYQEALNNKGSN